MRPLIRACTTSLFKSPCSSPHLRAPHRVLAQCGAERYRSDNTTGKAHPFHGYYEDLMDAPLHSVPPQTRTQPAPPPPDELPKTEEEERLAKARVVFGSRLAGPAERRAKLEKLSRTIAGVLVPPKPEEPDNCCNSGCVNCVWDRFREELEEWAEKSTEARVKLQEQNVKRQATELATRQDGTSNSAAVSMDDDGGGSGATFEMESLGQSGGDLFADIPVGIREFMKTEKRLKQRYRKDRTLAG